MTDRQSEESSGSHKFDGAASAHIEVSMQPNNIPHSSSRAQSMRTKSEPNLIRAQDMAFKPTAQDIATMQYLNKKARQAADNFLLEAGLAAEMPSTLIPSFTGKTSLWAERVENILRSRGMSNLDDYEVSRNFLPIILMRIPPDVAKDVPRGNLRVVLDYLKTIDRQRYDLNQCFAEGRKLERAPSQAFSALINRARKALPNLTDDGCIDVDAEGCPDQHLKTVAWTSLKAGLPQNLLALATALGIRFFPTVDQLETLDDAWADYMAAKDIPSVFSIRKDEPNETKQAAINQEKTNASIAEMVAKQSQQIRQLAELMTTSRCNNVEARPRGQSRPFARNQNTTNGNPRFNSVPPAQNNFQPAANNFRGRAQSAFRGRGNFRQQAQRFPNAVYPNRMDLCFYHRTFGREAKKHEEPCAWIFPTNK